MICLLIESLIWLHQQFWAEQGLDCLPTSVLLCVDQSNDLVQTNCSLHVNNLDKFIIVQLLGYVINKKSKSPMGYDCEATHPYHTFPVELGPICACFGI